MPILSLDAALPDASAVLRGVVSTGTQTFGGQKTFGDLVATNQINAGGFYSIAAGTWLGLGLAADGPAAVGGSWGTSNAFTEGTGAVLFKFQNQGSDALVISPAGRLSVANVGGTSDTYANAALRIPIAGQNTNPLHMIQLGGGTSATDWEMAFGFYTGSLAPVISSRASPVFFNLVSGSAVAPLLPDAIDSGQSTQKWRDGWFSRNVYAGPSTLISLRDISSTARVFIGTTDTGSYNHSLNILKQTTGGAIMMQGASGAMVSMVQDFVGTTGTINADGSSSWAGDVAIAANKYYRVGGAGGDAIMGGDGATAVYVGTSAARALNLYAGNASPRLAFNATTGLATFLDSVFVTTDLSVGSFIGSDSGQGAWTARRVYTTAVNANGLSLSVPTNAHLSFNGDDATHAGFYSDASQRIYFYAGGSGGLVYDTTSTYGPGLVSLAGGTHNLGSATNQWDTGFLKRLAVSNTGGTNAIELATNGVIHFNGTGQAGCYIQSSGTGTLGFGVSGAAIAFFDSNGLNVNQIYSRTATTVGLISTMADGASAVAFSSDTSTTWSNSTSKLHSYRNNASEKAYVVYDGSGYFGGGLTFAGNLSSSTTTSALYLNSSRTAASTSAVSASIEIGTSVTLDSGDLLVGFLHSSAYVSTIDKDGNLTGKSLATLAGNGSGAVSVGGMLSVQYTDTGNAGTGEDDLHTYTFPASSMVTTGRGVRYTGSGTFPNNANTKTLKVYFGASMQTVTLPTNEAGDWHFEATVVRTGASAQRYVIKSTYVTSGSNTFIAQGDLTQTESGTIAIKTTGEATSNNDIVQKFSSVEYI